MQTNRRVCSGAVFPNVPQREHSRRNTVCCNDDLLEIVFLFAGNYGSELCQSGMERSIKCIIEKPTVIMPPLEPFVFIAPRFPESV